MAWRHYWLALIIPICALGLVVEVHASEQTVAKPALPDKIDYNRDIRPVLSLTCFPCHGPDKASRKAKLRLDTREGAIADLEGSHAIVPGNLEKSELYKRIVSTDPEEHMPPPKAEHTLTDFQIHVLKRWLEQGAPYAEHWAFIKPQRAPFPQVKNAGWPHNGIDYFVLDRLEKEGLAPSPQADRFALIRRVTMDLTGLPPAPDEVDAFVNDKSSDALAYGKVVDRLLASSAYGERWARMWLDLARYADSAGYGSDPLRLNIWPYRDWVIEAFNRNLPYDQFTTEQIAGDLLPNATTSQILASAFHRNTMTNTEGGTDREEFRVAAVKDRANTTAQIWMGLTMGCAQCHSHKFDPISQKEYYQFFAFFNQTEDNDQPDERPTMPVPTQEQQQQTEKLKSEITVQEELLNKQSPEMDKEQTEWERSAGTEPIAWTVLDPAEFTAANGTTLTKQADMSLLASGKSPETETYTIKAATELKGITAIRVEMLPDATLPSTGPGRSGNGNLVLNDLRLKLIPNSKMTGISGQYVRVEIPGKQLLLSLAEVQVFSEGQNIALKGKASQISVDYDGPANLAIDNNTNGDFNAAKSVTHTKLEDNPWWEVDLTRVTALEKIVIWNRTDGGTGDRLKNFKVSVLDAQHKPVWQTMVAQPPNPSVNLEVSGVREIALQNATADFSQNEFPVANAIDSDAGPKSGWALGDQTGKAHSAVFEIAGSATDGPATLQFTLIQSFGKQHTIGRVRLSATTKAQPVRLLPEQIVKILALPADQRNATQKAELAAFYRPLSSTLAQVRKQIDALKVKLAALKPVQAPVMRELPKDKRRVTHIMQKGNFLTPGDPVEPIMISAFHPMPPGAPMNRMGVAEWLMDKQNPLTARVAVNRFWAQLFGAGIVETEEDFGTQGALPSHPELLDWLAVEFMDPTEKVNGTVPQAAAAWDIKALLKLMVTSATYQQSSRTTPELLEKDPRNRLLTRSPRRRLDAEMVRDQTLSLSGLLSRKIGGPSVYPPQPDGLWRAAFNGERTWSTSKGEDRYRRGMYTFWRRTVPYPSMATFDAPSREVCTMRRIPTNTPLQAFVTLNDPVYVEAAQALARRIYKEGGASTEERVRYALHLCLARPVRDEQSKSLMSLYQSELEHFRKEADAAKKMATEPLGALPQGMDPAELAAWTVVANVLLNLDGVLTKG